MPLAQAHYKRPVSVYDISADNLAHLLYNSIQHSTRTLRAAVGGSLYLQATHAPPGVAIEARI